MKRIEGLCYLKPEGYDCISAGIFKHHVELGGKNKYMNKAVIAA